MKGMKKRLVILVVTMAVVGGLLACSTGSLISRTEPTATPTKTPKPTFTATLTPTNTPIPTDTPPPTSTWTPTPLATNTPIVYTATPTSEPSNTPAPTNTSRPPTNTPRPRPRATNTPRPTPQPTNTPRPQFAWSGQVDFALSNCGLTRVFGFTLDRNGGLAGDIWVHYWADGWDGGWDQSEWTEFGGDTPYEGDEGNWDGVIDNYAKPGVWRVCVVPEEGSWDCISNTVDARTSSDCENDVQVVHITFRQN
jgi:hypothetical protein